MTDTNYTENESDCLASVNITVSDDEDDLFEFGNVDPEQNEEDEALPAKAAYFDRCQTFVQRHIRNIRDNSDALSKEVLMLHGLLNDHHYYLGQLDNLKLSNMEYYPTISYIGNPKRPCDNHTSLKEHPNGIKPGDKFESYKAFLDYVHENAKQWFFYYTCTSSKKDRHNPDVDDYFVHSCIYYGKYKQSTYKPKGIRNKKSRSQGCPCEVKLKHIRGTGNELVVTFVCNHHTHPLTKESFNSLPHLSRMPTEFLEEDVVKASAKMLRDLERNSNVLVHNTSGSFRLAQLSQFMALGVSKIALRKYIKMKTGLELGNKTLLNLAKRKLASAPEEPELFLEKIRNLELLYGDEVWADVKKKQTSGESRKKRIRNRSKKRNISVAHTLDSGPEKQLETSDHEQTNIECNNLSNEDKERLEVPSLKRRAKRTFLPDSGRKRSRLEKCLQKLSQDEETLVSVQKLQETVRFEEDQNRQNEDMSHGPHASILENTFTENKNSNDINDLKVINLEIGAQESYSDYDHTFQETCVSYETDNNENLQNENDLDINNSVLETDYVLQLTTDTNEDKALRNDDYSNNTERISKCLNDKQNKFGNAKYSKTDKFVELVKETKNYNNDLLGANSYDVIHIDKYNIDTYFQNSELLKYLGVLAKQTSMTVFGMLKTIYEGSAYIEMGVSRDSEDDDVSLTYFNKNTDINISSFSDTDEDPSIKPVHELYKYKELIVKAKEELKQLTNQISAVKKDLESLDAKHLKLSSSNRQLTIKNSMLREHLISTLHEIANNFVYVQEETKENILNFFCEKVSTIRTDGNIVICATDSTPKKNNFNNLEHRWCTIVNDFLNVICIALVKLVDSPSIVSEDESNNRHNNNDDGKPSDENESKHINNNTLNKLRHNQENVGSPSTLCKSKPLCNSNRNCCEIIITRHNIDSYLARSKTLLSMERLSKKLSMSLVNILTSIYKGEAIIKIVKNGEAKNNIDISYVKTNVNNEHSFNKLENRIDDIIRIVRKKMSIKLFSLKKSIISLKHYESSLKQSILLSKKESLPFCCNKNLQIMWRYFQNIEYSIKTCLLRTNKLYETTFPVTTRQLKSVLENILDDINDTDSNIFENIITAKSLDSSSLLQWQQMWCDSSKEVLIALEDFLHHILTPRSNRNTNVKSNTERASIGNILNTFQRINAAENTRRPDMATSSNDEIVTNTFVKFLSNELNIHLDDKGEMVNPTVSIDKDVAHIEFLLIDNIFQLRMNEKLLTQTKDIEANLNINEELVTCHNLMQSVGQLHILSYMILLANKLSIYYINLMNDIFQKKMAVKIVVIHYEKGKKSIKIWSIQGTACSELVSRNVGL